MFIIFLLLAFSLFSNDLSLAVTENDPSTLVEGVSVITGDFYNYQDLYTVQGAEPIHFKRCYLSRMGEMVVWPHAIAIIFCKEHIISVRERNVTLVNYTTEDKEREIGDSFYRRKEKSVVYTPFNFAQAKGVANTSSGNISGRTNLKNQKIVFDSKKDPKGKSFTLYAADGTVRRYTNFEKQKKTKDAFDNKERTTYQYKLIAESLPNGHLIQYFWNHENRLYSVRASNGNANRIFSEMSVPVHQFSKKYLRGSDGRQLILASQKHETPKKKISTIVSVRSPEYTDFSMGWHIHDQKALLTQYVFPQNRTLTVHYDCAHENRVAALLAPLGQDATLLPCYSFAYDIPNKHTDVYDAKQNKTSYYWDDSLHICTIDHYDGAKLVHSDRFVWDKHLLKCKAVVNDSKQLIFAKTFAYDELGNPVEEVICGNLTGQGSLLQLNAQGMPQSGVEKFVKTAVFSSDGKNLPLQQNEGNGRIITLSYVPGTDLIKTKDIYDHQTLKIRYIYDYDADLILGRETIDDGVVRLIKSITPTQSGPFTGLPWVIEEKYLEAGKEKLLKKTVLHYTTGALVSQKDIYDANDKLQYRLHYDYNAKGQITRETNALGQEAIYKYDENGNCIYLKNFSGFLETFQKFDFSNRLIEKEEKGFDGTSRVTKYFYDVKSQLVREIDHFGSETTYEYDAFGHVITTKLPPMGMERGELVSPVTYKKYDSAGNVISLIDGEGNETRTAYNAYNKPTCIEHPDGAIEKKIYNLDGSLQSEMDANGVSTAFTYDYLGRVTSKTIGSKNLAQETFVYSGMKLIKKIDAEGNETIFSYDGAGRKISEEMAGEKSIYTYDVVGRVHSVQTGDLVTITEYDLLDRVIEERKESVDGVVLRKTNYEYDAAGNRSVVIHGNGGREEYKYDAQNRVVWKKDAFGAVETTIYDEHFVNEHGQKVLQERNTDPLGLEIIKTYNTHNKVVCIEKRREQTLFLCNQWYDKNGALILQKDTIFPDKRQSVIRWVKDSRSRNSKLIEGEGTLDSKVTSYTYTPIGALKSVTKPDGVVLNYDYTELGAVQELVSSDGSVKHHPVFNRLGQFIEGDGLKREVDAKGRLLSEIFPTGLSIASIYDKQGRRTSVQIPQADCDIRYEYNVLDMRAVHRNYLNGGSVYTHTFDQYDLEGNCLAQGMIYQLGKIEKVFEHSRIRKMGAPHFEQEVMDYDLVGNMRQERKRGEVFDYGYDSLYQLTHETGRHGHSYRYDSLNNRVQKDEARYDINALQQVVGCLGYDKNGNVTQKEGMRLFYDALDRLIRIENAQGKTEYSYDYLHRRLAESGNGRVRYFLYDGLNEIGSFNADLKPEELRILGDAVYAEIGAAVAHELQGKVYAPVHDIQGNVAVLIPVDRGDGGGFCDRIKNGIWGMWEPTFFEYNAFGEGRIEGYASHNPWRFSSKRVDPSGLVFYGRRYYMPDYGRWLTPDPEGFTDGANLYAFVGNNPLVTWDEYGLLMLQPYGGVDRDWNRPAWNTNFGGSGFPNNLSTYGNHLMSKFSHDIFKEMPVFGSWRQAGHQGIDRLFNTNLIGNYTRPGLFGNSSLPSPTNILGTVSKTGQYFMKTLWNTKRAYSQMGQVANASAQVSKAKLSVFNSGWALPEKGGAYINGRWYTEHALERIAPRTPQVMAKLEVRALEKASTEGFQPGTAEFGQWMIRNGPKPRGIPPSVVEAEIVNPGSTNVRVMLNQQGDVITVIPGGR